MRITFALPSTDGECRCIKCGRLLAKVKNVNMSARIEIKCTGYHDKKLCKTMNTFEITKNPIRNKENV